MAMQRRAGFALLCLYAACHAGTADATVRRGRNVLNVAKRAGLAQPDYSIYTRNSELTQKVRDIVAATPDYMRLETLTAEESGYKASIDVVTVDFHKASGATEPPLRVFLNFGEHGRELITTDVGLHVLKLLARRAVLTLTVEKLNLLKAHAATAETPVTHAWGPDKAAQTGGVPLAADALRRTIFKIVPNENNNGRNKVEGGELCLRKNGRGVDTNRNWEVDWGKKEKDYDPYEEYPGTRALSEPEVQMLKATLEGFRPHAWVNVHSGMEAMFLPFDHKAMEADGPKGEAMKKILGELKATRCAACVVGSGGASVGYLAHGTATDHLFALSGVPVTFTWEIYGDMAAANDDCFRMFNPLERGLHDAVVSNWAAASLDLTRLLIANIPVAWDPPPSVASGNATLSATTAATGAVTRSRVEAEQAGIVIGNTGTGGMLRGSAAFKAPGTISVSTAAVAAGTATATAGLGGGSTALISPLACAGLVLLAGLLVGAVVVACVGGNAATAPAALLLYRLFKRRGQDEVAKQAV